MPETSILREIARFVHRLDLADIPSDVLHHARLCVMDALECCLSSQNDERKMGALDSVDKDARLPCTLYGTGQRAGMADAAFYNTVSGAVSYRNDVSIVGKGHPGSVVIPTVLAVAQRYGLSGKRAMEGVIAGYETTIRMGSMLGYADFPYAFRPTAFTGPVGAAFAAAKTEGLSEGQIVSAASFAFNCAGGLNEWAVAGTGEDVIQNGWAARSGVLCTELAMAGVPAAESVVEGKFGFLEAYGLREWAGWLTEKLGQEYYILDTKFKQLPACMNVQNAAQIAQQIASRPGFDPAGIDRVYIEMTQGGKDWPNGDNTEIHTLIQAAMSVPFTVAQTLLTGNCDEIKWMPPYTEETAALMKRCQVTANPEYTKIQKEHQVVGITVAMKDGRTFRGESLDARTLTEDEVVKKFQTTVRRLYGAESAGRLMELLSELEKLDSISPILEILK